MMVVRYAKATVQNRDQLPPPGRMPGGTLFHDDGMIATFDFAGLDGDRSEPLSAEETRASVRRVADVDVTFASFAGGLASPIRPGKPTPTGAGGPCSPETPHTSTHPTVVKA